MIRNVEEEDADSKETKDVQCQDRSMEWHDAKEDVADLKETKTFTGLESADGVAADGPEEYSKKMLICVVWQSADDSIADESEREKSRFYWNSDDLVVI